MVKIRNKANIMMVFVVLLGAFMHVVAAGSTTITIGDINVAPSKSITVPIMVNNVSNLGAADIKLAYNANVVRVTSVADSDFEFLNANLEKAAIGNIRIIAYQTGETGLDGNVKVANVTLQAVGNIGNSSILDLSGSSISDNTPQQVDILATLNNGAFAIVQLIGDVNNDGKVDIQDLVIVGQHFREPTTQPYPAYDINQDGFVNILDLVAVGQHFGT